MRRTARRRSQAWAMLRRQRLAAALRQIRAKYGDQAIKTGDKP